MSKRIQIVIPDTTAKELEVLAKKEGHESESACGRRIIEEWLTLRRYGVIKKLTNNEVIAPGGIPSIMRMSGSPIATEYNRVSTESLLK